MDRRRYLALCGTGLGSTLAGCMEERGEIGDSAVAAEPDSPERGDDESPGDGPSDESDADESGCDPTVRLNDRELVVEERGRALEAYAELLVENVGDGASGPITLEVEWYDGEGNYFGDDSTRLPTLDAGERWAASVRASVADAGAIDDFEVRGEVQMRPPRRPGGLTVVESDLRVEDDAISITGVAENGRDDAIDYVEALGKVYDENGTVVGGNGTNERDIPAGTDWRFEMLLPGGDRAGEPADHEVLLAARSRRFGGH